MKRVLESWKSLDRISKRDGESGDSVFARENWALQHNMLDGERGLTDIALECGLARNK